MVETKKAKQVTSAAASLLYPELDFGVASNATYTRESTPLVLSHTAFEDEFANAGVKVYQWARGDDVDLDANACNPLARALLYNLRDLRANGIGGQFDAVRDKLFAHAARKEVFEKPVDVAIYFHDWLFYRANRLSISKSSGNRGFS